MSYRDLRIDLTHPSLFGNEAAEDEDDDIFESIWVRRPEEDKFLDVTRRVAIVNAYKGEGKSGLLRAVRHVIQETSGALAISTTGPAARPEVEGFDTSRWNRAWKASILNLVACEVGTNVGVAWDDDAIGLVELAEKSGFRRKSILSCITNRLSSPKLPLQRCLDTPASPQHAISRHLDPDSKIWVFIDDIDRNYENITEWAASLAGFFDAIRELSNTIPQMVIRASIRPNVWAATAQEYESLSHIRQYLVPLKWTEEDALNLLARRIEAYLKRTEQLETFKADSYARTNQYARNLELLNIVFATPVEWGSKSRPIHVPLYTLAKHRPRWIVELCKLAAERAAQQKSPRIELQHVSEQMAEFGRRRKADMAAEFGPQCPDLADLVDAFHRQPEEFSTAELLTLIENRILNHLKPRISGALKNPTSREVASFLFEIGFIYGRRNMTNGEYEHVGYADNPNLFVSNTNTDAGLRWEVHPAFRQILEMRDHTGRRTKGLGQSRG